MILLDTHVWVRWLAPESRPLTADVPAVSRCRLLTLDDTVRQYPELNQLLA